MNNATAVRKTNGSAVKKVTQIEVDNLAYAKEEVDRLAKELEAAKVKLAQLEAPIVAYIDSIASPQQGVKLTGGSFLVEFGKQRETRKVTNPYTALIRLEAVQQGLGYSSISIPVGVLEKNLRPTELEGLFEVTYGARHLKLTKLP